MEAARLSFIRVTEVKLDEIRGFLYFIDNQIYFTDFSKTRHLIRVPLEA